MRAILERDFFFFAAKKRYFILRMNAVALPLVFMMLLAMTMRGEARDQVGIALFVATGYSILLFTIFITPAMLAHVIAEERRNNKLDVLRSSPISAAGIVLGKWLSRVGLIATLVIAALPLNAAALLFGGVSPAGFLKSTIIIFVTMLWVSSLALFIGATSKDLGNVVRRSYVAVVVLFVLEFTLMSLLVRNIFSSGSRSGVLQWIGEAAAACNPLILLSTATFDPGSNTLLGMGPIAIHCVITLLVTVCLLGASIRSLVREPKAKRDKRNAAPEEQPALAASAGGILRGGKFSRNLRLLWRRPAVWLEVRRGASRRKSTGRKILLFSLLGIMELIFVVQMFELRDGGGPNDMYAFHMFPIMICLFIATFVTASLGASAIHRDNEANTRDVLHSTPLSNRQLAQAKVAGVLSATRFWWLLAMGHALVGMLLGDLHPLSFVGCGLVSSTLLIALAALAIIIGMKSTSTTRANVGVLAMIVIHLFIYPICIMLMLAMGGPGGSEEAIGFFMGHHPGFMVALPLILFNEPRSADELSVWVPSLFYFAGYVLLAFMLVSSRVPEIYARLREDGPRGQGQAIAAVPIGPTTAVMITQEDHHEDA